MISEYIHAMPNEDLAMILRNSGVKVGPITDTTRLVYERKLARIQQGIPPATAPADTTRLVYERKLARIQQGIPQATAPAGEFRDLLNSTARQYSMMSSEDIKDLTNEELATVLRNSGARVGPITDTTRLVYERKLVRIQQGIPPATAPAEEEDDEEEDEEEEETTGSVYEEKPSARSYDLSTKLTRSVTRRSHRGASPPPDISLDKLPGSVHQKGSRKQRGKTQKKLSPEEQPFHLLPGSVPEKVKLRNHSVQNFVEITPPKEPKPLPKSKQKSNIPRSSHADYANSTVIHPDTNKSHTPRKSFGLSDSFHIYSTRSHPENNAKAYSEKEHVDNQNFVTAGKETLEVNETDSDASMGSPQDSDFDNQFADSPHDSDYDDHPADSFFLVKKTSGGYSPKLNFDFSQEMDSSELVYDTVEPTKQSEKFSSQIPRKWSSKSHTDDQKISPVFKKSNIPASHIGKSKSLDKAPSSKKSNSIWKLDPVEEQNIQRGLSESQTDSTNSSVRYDYLPKAFVEKYGKYMNQSGVGSTSVKKCQSIDSLLFQSNREQAKSSSTDSVARVKPEKLTSTYQRFTSPLISKISGGNNAPPSYIGTPGSSRMNTSLTRKPLSSMREEVQFTSLRNSQATSASAASAPKKKMSIMIKLFIMIVFGLIAWLIYINFESPAAKPLLTTNH